MTERYLEPEAEFFARASMPKEIADLLDEWPEIDASTARLVRAAVHRARPGRCAGRGTCWQRGQNLRRRCDQAGADALLTDQRQAAPAPDQLGGNGGPGCGADTLAGVLLSHNSQDGFAMRNLFVLLGFLHQASLNPPSCCG